MLIVILQTREISLYKNWLNWKRQISDIAIKLNKANVVNIWTPFILFSLFCGQNSNSIKRLFVLQNKSLRIIYIQNYNAHTSPIFRESNILKLLEKIALENCFFISKYFNKFLPTTFTFSSDFHNYNTRWSNLRCLFVPSRITLNCIAETQSILVLSTHGIIYIN